MIARVRQILGHRAKVSVVAHIMVIRVIALAGNVCSGLLTAAYLGPAGRGEQAALLVAPTLLAAVGTLGLHASIVYNTRSDPDRASWYFGTSLVLAFLSSMTAAAVGWFLMPFWLARYDIETIRLARLLLLTVPLGLIPPTLSGVLEAHGHFGVANRVLYFQSLGTLVLLGLLVALGCMTPHLAAMAYIAPALPSLIYLFVQAHRVVKPRLAAGLVYPRRLLRYGLKFYGVDILGALSGYLDQVVIVFLLEPEAVGAYAVALSLSRVLNVAQGAVSTVLFPSVAARETGSVITIVARAARVTLVVNAAGATCIALAGPFLLVLLYGQHFKAAVLPFMILLAEAVITSAARTLAQAFSSTGRPGAVTTVELAGVAASLIAMLLLIPHFGIVGAACGALIGGVVRFLCVTATFRAVLGVGVPPLLISRADIAWVTGR